MSMNEPVSKPQKNKTTSHHQRTTKYNDFHLSSSDFRQKNDKKNNNNDRCISDTWFSGFAFSSLLELNFCNVTTIVHILLFIDYQRNLLHNSCFYHDINTSVTLTLFDKFRSVFRKTLALEEVRDYNVIDTILYD